MKIVFFGTPFFAAQILQYLLEKGVSIAAIVTQPDKPQGRHLQSTPPPVKQLALSQAFEIPILQPQKASEAQFLSQLEEIRADLFVVVAYGQILSPSLLSIPHLGCINLHASLLPKYRGAAPIQRCLMNGEKESGVSVQQMVYQLDAGDVIDEAKIAISPEMTFGELEQKLCGLSKPLLLSVIGKYQKGRPAATSQNPAFVTFAPKIKAEELEIIWNHSSGHIHNQIRALSPRPGAWCWIEQGGRKRLKILRSRIAGQSGSPGELLVFQKDMCRIAAGVGSLQILEVQPEGKKAMPIGDWIRGCHIPPQFI